MSQNQKPPNPRLSKRERGLLKGAIRRVFSRSDLRRQVIDASVIKGHTNTTRPKVKTWCRCSVCTQPEAKSYMQVDHIQPIVPVNTSFEEMSVDTLVDNLWCDPLNLQAICIRCHKAKGKVEAKARREHRKSKKKSTD